ncbi:NAD(P)H-binding protein [Nakamurella leprariae]|uniref:NAD(P)H-binding protein n=1 Tax=Nakamurella leprariae TaxID=2803911 RepID=A0A939C3M6_9ACTN|nr:NAD(P)H-binding protein [Nakamurella leprariae]MBM9469584.1 NAD(P)H-binding protein [Nakamurella leprariae]
MSARVLVTGATGFIGSHLVPALVEAGHEVLAMTRRPDSYGGPGQAVGADVDDPDSLRRALDGVEIAYYLVHSLDTENFEAKDAAAARAFGRAAKDGGVRQIIYLGGLGDDAEDLSAHLRSRREVEDLLGEAGVPVTVLRAAIVIGHGGISWEITRQLVEHLPAMIAPKWVETKTQPIALPDVIRYLVGVFDRPEAFGRVYEIGGPEVLSYRDMLKRAARLQKHRDVPIIPVPLLTPRLSSGWLALITDVDTQTGRNLIDSMSNEVVVHDRSIEQLVPGEPLDYDEAVRLALADRAAAGAADQEPARSTGPQG